jgi:hypothetical protein
MELLIQARMPIVECELVTLTNDIREVAKETDAATSGVTTAFKAAMELKRRIGGLGALPRYMRCLMAPTRHAHCAQEPDKGSVYTDAEGWSPQ